MPQVMEVHVEWKERIAYWPVRSSWSKKYIWLKKYWQGSIYHDSMGRPPLKSNSWSLIYTKNEYLLMLLRQDESNYNHPVPQFKSIRT
jgi:hypothetical protein